LLIRDRRIPPWHMLHVGEGAQAVIGNVQPRSEAGANQAIIEPEEARPLKRSGSLAKPVNGRGQEIFLALPEAAAKKFAYLGELNPEQRCAVEH